jgi:Amt family ammonium transporter
VLGGLGFGFFDSADRVRPGTTVPEHAYMAFQLAFAAVTAAVVSGSVAGKITLTAWVCFILLWHTIVYVPLARWVWHPEGWLNKRGVLDFAGGLVVEGNSGVSGFVLAAIVGWQARRAARGGGGGFESGGAPHGGKQHSVLLILLGAGLLHFGWLGFNAGSAIAAGYDAARAFLNTHLAASAGIVGFAAAEALWGGARGCCGGRWGRGQPTAVGAATGVIVGLVAITPACGYVSQMASLLIGFAASVLAYAAEASIHRITGVEDVLNAFSGHGVGGLFGVVAVGVFASTSEASPTDGLVKGNAGLLGVQLLGVLVCVATATVGTALAWAATCAGFWAMGASPLLAPEHAEGVDEALLKGESAWGDLTSGTDLTSVNLN